ncbi:MAG TPA: amidohydrolase family protein [Polyangia bacterium]|nr:amidohydrolase family protein [Polyangia bacterium]
MSILLLLAVQSLRCAVVWDGAGHAFADGRILVHDQKIVAVGPAQKVAAAPGELDLRPLFCMPGLVDAHTHVTSFVPSPDDTEEVARAWAQKNARLTLEAGITSARDLGDSVGLGVWIRDRIEAGQTPGPRLQVACEQIGPNPLHQVASPAELRELVREHVRRGCDVIKLFATTGMGANDRFLSLAQIRAATDEAHKHKLRVAVHVIARGAVADCVAAGVDSIEHGPGTDVALAREMKRKGIVLTPTLYILRYYIEDAANIKFAAEHVARLKELVDGDPLRPFEQHFPEIIKTGVKIAAGSDSFMKLHGKNATELVWLVRAGLSAEQALFAMTRVAAELMGWGDRVGTLAAGRYADVIALDADPRKDIRAVQAAHVRLVMKGGAIVKHVAAQPNGAAAP